MMQKLVDGVHAFQGEYFAKHRSRFRPLADRGQHPETRFITCSDSRVDPNLITTTEPGELFIVRNVGNLVPHVSVPGGTAAAIEYAVEVLGVANVVRLRAPRTAARSRRSWRPRRWTGCPS